MSGRPLDVLEAAVDDQVSVRLKGGETYRGTLTGYDQHMNLVLEELESSPATDAVPSGDAGPDEDASGGEDTTVIRGDNVVSITL